MTQPIDLADKRQILRATAELMLGNLPPDASVAQPNEVLMHELLVHKVELEMQNEELRKAHLAMEEARDNYWHLYEFSPVGYLVISRESLITTINLTGAAMLSTHRAKLMNQRFPNYIAPHEQDRWHRLFFYMMQKEDKEKQCFDFEMCHDSGYTFHVHLDCMRMKLEDAAPQLRVTLTDITKLKEAQNDLRIAAIVFESTEPMMVTDANAVILRTNQAFSKSAGYALNEVVGKKSNMFNSGRHSPDFYSAMWKSIRNVGRWEGEILNKRKNGDIYAQWLCISAVKNDANEITNYVGIYSHEKSNTSALRLK